MPFPASLQIITVTGNFTVYPGNDPSSGSVKFTSTNWLFSPDDNEIVPPFATTANVTAGAFTIDLPATNDPQWAPAGWSYAVEITIDGTTLTGSIMLPYDGPDPVDIADIFTPASASAGQLFILITQKGFAGGVAALDDDGDVIDAAGNKILGGGGGGSVAWDDVTGKPSTFTPSLHASSHADGGSDEISVDGSQVTSGTVPIARIPTGTTGSTVPFGNDARFTDARTPTAHAASHQDGGSDELALDASQVTSGSFAIGRIPTGSSSSTVTIGNDARLSDARTPTAHATSHQDGGSDELALDGSQITSGTVAIGRIPTGTSGTTVPFGNDSRFTDARTPTAHATSHQDGGSDELALDASQVTTGTLGVARGGTGVASVTANSYIKGNGTSAVVERTYAQVKTDLSLDLVDNVSIVGRFSLITSGEETLDRLQTFGDVDMVLGSVHLTYFTARKTETINNVVTAIPSTAGASNTTSRIGIYTIDGSGNLTLTASTANDTALWTSTGTRTKALSSSWSKVAGTRYAVGMLTIGGTPAQPGGVFTIPSLSGTAPRVAGEMTGQSSLPSSISVGSIVDSYRMYQVLFTP